MGYLTRMLSFLMGAMGFMGLYYAHLVEYSKFGFVISALALLFAGAMWEDAERQLRV